MINRLFNFFLISFLAILILNPSAFAFHKKKAMKKTVYEDLNQMEVQSKYCTSNVNKVIARNDAGKKIKGEDGKFDQEVNADGKKAWEITGYHQPKPRVPKKIFKVASQKLPDGYIINFSVQYETTLGDVLKIICLQYKDYPTLRPDNFRKSGLENLFEIIAKNNDLISKIGKNYKSGIGQSLYDNGIIIDVPERKLAWYLPDYLIEDIQEQTIKKEEKQKKEADKKKRKAKEAKAKKWVEENKPKLLKKVKAKLKEYDGKIKEINDDFSQLDTTLKQYVSTFNYALDGVEETFNITGNKANKEIKDKLKELRQKKKLHLNEAQQKIFDTKFNDIRKTLGTLKNLNNYQNITKLIKNINSVTKSKNKIKGYEEDFDSLKSKKLESEKIELDIAKLNDEITKEKNNIDTVISLKEEIDALDNELSEKSIFDDITKIAIYVIIFLLILGLIVYLILQNRKMNKMNLTSKKSTESKFDRLEDRIRESTASMQRAQQIRSKQETTLSSQPKEQPKTAEEITIGKYEEMMNNYKEALDNFSKVAAFKQKWNGLALTRKERQDGTKTILINSSRAFEKSEIWCVNFDDKYFALPGSSVKSNMAAYMNLDFEKAQRDFKGVFSISSGSSYFTEVCLLRRGGAGFVVERIGKLQFPQ